MRDWNIFQIYWVPLTKLFNGKRIRKLRVQFLPQFVGSQFQSCFVVKRIHYAQFEFVQGIRQWCGFGHFFVGPPIGFDVETPFVCHMVCPAGFAVLPNHFV